MEKIYILDLQKLLLEEVKIVSETKSFYFIDYYSQKTFNKIRKSNINSSIFRVVDFYFNDGEKYFDNKEILDTYLNQLKQYIIKLSKLNS